MTTAFAALVSTRSAPFTPIFAPLTLAVPALPEVLMIFRGPLTAASAPSGAVIIRLPPDLMSAPQVPLTVPPVSVRVSYRKYTLLREFPPMSMITGYVGSSRLSVELYWG